MVGLSDRSSVEGLEVNSPPGFTTVFGDHDHPGAPGHWCVDGDRLNDPEGDVSHEVSVDLLLPVQRNGHWGVDSNWLDISSGWDWQRFTLHQRQGLSSASVKG